MGTLTNNTCEPRFQTAAKDEQSAVTGTKAVTMSEFVTMMEEFSGVKLLLAANTGRADAKKKPVFSLAANETKCTPDSDGD